MAKCEKCGVPITGAKALVKCKLCELAALSRQREGIAEMVRKELEKTYCELDQIESVVYEIMRYAGEGE